MSDTIQAKNITLYDPETKFNLQLTEDTEFFPEWQIDLPNITVQEKEL
jgi:hypothetical protein